MLIDNLTSVGRFDDARSAIALYPDQSRRLVAFGAVAESMGRRGVSTSALKWIEAEIPLQYRSELYRRVNNGIVTAIEQNRSKDISSGGRDR